MIVFEIVKMHKIGDKQFLHYKQQKQAKITAMNVLVGGLFTCYFYLFFTGFWILLSFTYFNKYICSHPPSNIVWMQNGTSLYVMQIYLNYEIVCFHTYNARGFQAAV